MKFRGSHVMRVLSATGSVTSLIIPSRRRLKWLAVLVALVLGPAVTGIGTEVREPNRPVAARGLNDGSFSPFALEAMKRHGETLSDPFPNDANHGRIFNPEGEAIGPLTLDPVQKVITLCVEFTTPPYGGSDDRLDLTYIDDLFFGTVYDPPAWGRVPGHPTNRTLRNYYDEVSYGQIDVVTDDLPSTIGWIQVGKPYDYYCRADGVHNRGRGPYPENVYGLVIDAIRAADAHVDFSRYAVDGVVPNLVIVFAGASAQFSGDPALLSAGQGELSNLPDFEGCSADGVSLDAFVVTPELHGDPAGYLFGKPLGPWPPTVGHVAHEFGHMLGLCDEYDYGHESDGVGAYSLMGGGNWTFWYPNASFPGYMMLLGNSPTHPSAWGKCRLGFVTPVVVPMDTPMSVELPPVEFEPLVYRMEVPNSGGKEYFLLENRQHVGFDQGMIALGSPKKLQPFSISHGLAIWHIDDTVLSRTYWRPNEAENWKELRWEGWRKNPTNGETHYGISLIQSDDQWDLEHMFWGYGDTSDLYPGSLGVTRFGSDTFPNSSTYYFWPGSPPPFGYSGMTVDHIAEVDGVITADLSYSR